MRKIALSLLMAVMLLCSASLTTSAQGGDVATPASFIAWDYLDVDLTSATVVRFELSIDGGTFASVGIPTNSTPIEGGRTYLVPMPALTPGSHTVAMRACNADLCGDPTAALGFRLAIVPNTPRNLRIQRQ